MEQGGAGMSVLTKEALVKGTFAGAGVKSEREALTGEDMQQLELIRREVAGQDAILDEMSTKLDELKDVAERIGDVSAQKGRCSAGRRCPQPLVRTFAAERGTVQLAAISICSHVGILALLLVSTASSVAFD
jgi:hypothetical protein